MGLSPWSAGGERKKRAELSAGRREGQGGRRRTRDGNDELAGGRTSLAGGLDLLLIQCRHASLESLDELRVAAGADHAIELRAVIGDEAQVLDEDVVGEPAISLEGEPRLHGDLRSLGGDDARAHHRLVARDLLAHVVEAFAPVLVDAGDVGLLEQIGEELGELLTLSGRALLPMQTQHALRGLRGVEGLAGHLAYLRALLGQRQAGVLQYLQNLVRVGAKLFGGGAGPAIGGETEGEGEGEKNTPVPVHA